MNKIFIETERLILRPFTKKDSVEYFLITRDKYVQEYVPYLCPESLEETRQHIGQIFSSSFKNDIFLILEKKDTNKIVGAIAMNKNFCGEYDMSLITAVKYRRQGFMKEAIYALYEYMPKGTELMFIINKNNNASYSLVRNLKGVKDTTDTKSYYAFKLSK